MNTLQSKYIQYTQMEPSHEASEVLDFIDNATTDYTKDFSFFLPFVDIIIDKIHGYTNYNTSMEKLSAFLEDMNKG